MRGGLLEYYNYWGRGHVFVPGSSTISASASASVVVAGAKGGTGYATNVLTLSPTAFWDMQETTGNIADSSGNGFDATAKGSGASYRTTGLTINSEPLYGIDLNGTAYFDIEDQSTLTQPSTSGFTLSAWVKHPADAASKRSLFWNNSTGQGCFYLRKGNGYGLDGVTVNTTDTAHGQAVDGSEPFDNTWQWVALRYDTSGTPTLRAYHDTDTFDDTTFSGTWKRDGTPSVVQIGYGGSPMWNGEIALVAYWNTPLSDANMTKLRTGSF